MRRYKEAIRISQKWSPMVLLVCAFLMASALPPPSSGKITTMWDLGETGLDFVCTYPTGGALARNLSLPRNSNVSSATVQIRGDPYIKNEGLGNQTVQWPKNPSMDILGDGSPDWAFKGTMGMQDRFSDDTDESDLWWNSSGQTQALEFTVPRSTIRSASLTVNNSDARKFSYVMTMGGTQVWNKEILSFAYNGTSFTRDTINHVVFGDINGDKKMEMVAGGANGRIYIAKSVNGKWMNATVLDLQIQSSQRDIMQVALGNLDGTPGPDIIAACKDGNVYYLLNQGGAGLYSGANQLLSGSIGQMASVTVDDVDGDGNSDIVAGNLNGRFYVFLNAGEASFDPSNSDGLKVVPGGNGQMNGVAVYDIDQDGNMDLLGANSNKCMYIAKGTGEHSSFESARPVITTATNQINSIYVEDINGDGYKDLLGASNDGRVYVCLNLGSPNFGGDPGSFDSQPGHLINLPIDSGTGSLSTAIARDLNGDGLPDIVALGYNTGQVSIAMNDGGKFYPENFLLPFKTGQISRSLAVDDVDGDGDLDIGVANGLKLDVWLNNQGNFTEAITGPGFVDLLQDYINNAAADTDKYGNPMVTVRLQIYNMFTGSLHFSGLAITYSYSALVDFTGWLSDHMNATAGPYSEGEMLQIPVVFKVESAGVVHIEELRIDSEMGLVPIISFPTDNSTLYYNEKVELVGLANKDPDGIALNYTWTDTINGRFLGYGNKVKYTPTAKGDITVQLLVKDELHGNEASLSVHFQVVDRPTAYLKISKLVLSNREPTVGEDLTMTVFVANYPGTIGIGRLNVSNVGFQVYLDEVQGTPITTGIVRRVDVNSANSIQIVWNVQTTPGTHKFIVVIRTCDQQFTSTQYTTTINVQQSYAASVILPLFIFGIIPASLGALAIFLGVTEAGIYALFLLFLPLYSKMKPEEVLDSFIRGKILGYIRANPGCHYNLIKQDLKLHNGTLIHHLDTLERNGFVKSARDGLLRRFFPGDQKIPQGRFFMNPMQKSMSRYIREHPGVSQAELTRGLYLEPHVVRYHIKILKEAQILRVEDDGSRTRLFLR